METRERELGDLAHVYTNPLDELEDLDGRVTETGFVFSDWTAAKRHHRSLPRLYVSGLNKPGQHTQSEDGTPSQDLTPTAVREARKSNGR
jgi:hypothetical protein